jgi:competence protein ComEA
MKKLFHVMICVLLFGLLLGAPSFASDLVNINTATVEELISLPGIGPATAAKIVEYREGHPFATVEEVLEVKGIGPAKYETIKNRITVGDAPTKKE